MLLFMQLGMLLATFAMRLHSSFRLSLLPTRAYPACLFFPSLPAPGLCHFRNSSILRAGLGTWPCSISCGPCCSLPSACLGISEWWLCHWTYWLFSRSCPTSLVPSALLMTVCYITFYRSLISMLNSKGPIADFCVTAQVTEHYP